MVTRAYDEALAIANAHGIDTDGMSLEPFLDKAPSHLPSIRQDYERQRALELDALVVAPQNLRVS